MKKEEKIKRAEIMEAYNKGKKVQCLFRGKWEDFVPQNQVDSPNLDFQGIDNWRIKPT